MVELAPPPLHSVVAVMAALSDEDVARVILALESRGYSVRQRDTGAQTAKVILEEKHFRRIEKFGGEAGKWQEWLFAVCVAVGSVSPDCILAMEDVTKQAGSIRDVAMLDAVVKADVKKKFSAELFGVLCALTSGEANVVVRSIIQKGAGYCGFAALCALSQRFNPKTPARILQFLSTVLNPPSIKDVRLLERAVEEWEIKIGKLKVEFEEEFSDNVKVAIITGMVPRDLQDMIFQMGRAGEDLGYREVRDKVMSIASHRSQMAIPTPMDIGYLGQQEQIWDGSPDAEHGWDFSPDLDVDAVGKAGTCHRCGGWGHFARECPTPEGKGQKGKGKEKGSGDPKGWGKGGAKATGKEVFQGRACLGRGTCTA